MVGLLGNNTSGGLLARLPGNRGATREAMRRKMEEDARRAALMAPAQAPRPVMGGLESFGQFLLGGTEGVHQTRERRRAAPAREASIARMNRLQPYVDTLSPDLQLAFETNREKLGEAFASRGEAVTLDPGDVRMHGDRTIYGAPFDATPGSSVFNPLNPGQPLAIAAQENKVAGGALVAPDGRVLYRGPQVEGVAATADAFYTPEIAQGQGGGAPRIERQARPDTVTVGDGAEVYDPASGQIIARNAPDAPPVDPRAAQQAAGAANAALERIRNTRAKVDEAMGATNATTAGFFGGMTAGVGGTPAANLAATIDTIEANLSFSELQKMRDNSPTGGALGQVTERELALLGATVASLRQSQSPEQLRKNLGVIRDSLARWEANVRAGQQQAPASAQGGVVSVSTPAEAQALPPGTRYRTPQGQEYIR